MNEKDVPAGAPRQEKIHPRAEGARESRSSPRSGADGPMLAVSGLTISHSGREADREHACRSPIYPTPGRAHRPGPLCRARRTRDSAPDVAALRARRRDRAGRSVRRGKDHADQCAQWIDRADLRPDFDAGNRRGRRTRALARDARKHGDDLSGSRPDRPLERARQCAARLRRPSPSLVAHAVAA